MKYLIRTAAARKKTPQTEPVPGRKMIKNNAGGYAFEADSFQRLLRFLILGTEGGTYYVTEQDLTKQNVDNIVACVLQDHQKTINTIVEVSEGGRAPKNDPALFALAACAASGNDKAQAMALGVLPRVARTGTDLFTFCAFIDNMRGWGPALRRAVAEWYQAKPVGKLAYQLVKYQQRNGWSNADLFRLAHIKGSNSPLYRWVLGADMGERNVQKWMKGKKETSQTFHYRAADTELPEIIQAFEEAKTASEDRIVQLILDKGLTREMLPTTALNSQKVWEALLEKMPLTAMIRNLGKMSNVGLLKQFSTSQRTVIQRLTDGDYLRKSRVHPIKVLTALLTYGQGHGTKGKLTWDVIPQVKDALNTGFYSSFTYTPPTGLRYCVGVDVSSSMSMGHYFGIPGMTPCMGAAAMSMLIARLEQNYFIGGFAHVFRDLGITASDSLEAAMRKAQDQNFGGTDASIPMWYALKKNMPVDCFITISDGESWAGDVHAFQVLNQYRKESGINAKFVAINMVANRTSTTDPTDPGSMDVVGFDANVPPLISEFVGSGNQRLVEEPEETEE